MERKLQIVVTDEDGTVLDACFIIRPDSKGADRDDAVWAVKAAGSYVAAGLGLPNDWEPAETRLPWPYAP